jgi:hypothetical protein
MVTKETRKKEFEFREGTNPAAEYIRAKLNDAI